jgi:predicted Zn-dependent protease
MFKVLEKAHELFNIIKSQADFVGIRLQQNSSSYSAVRNSIVDGVGFSEDIGAMVEVMVDGHIGYGATNSLDVASIQQAFEKAKKLAEVQKVLGLYKFDDSVRGREKFEYISTNNPFQVEDIAEITQQFKHQTLVASKLTNIVSAKAYLDFTNSHVVYLNTHGAVVDQQTNRFYHQYQVIASNGDEAQPRTREDMSSSAKIVLDATEVFEKLGQQANELLVAPNCPSKTVDLILPPDQLYLQVHESIGHPLELDRILGDERNYAGWSFINLEDFGSLQYGSNLLNVTFDPTISGELASYTADDAGMKASKEYLIKDGKLLRGIGGVESQKRSNVDGVSSQRAVSWNRPAIDRMGNINIEPGESSFNSMVSSIEDGIIMRTNKSWSIDDYRNKFQFGCEYGEVIKDGEIKGVVRNPNYRGISSTFWKSLAMVGDKSTSRVLGSPFCGKGEPNQMINVGHSVPACLFKNIEIFGGES